MPVETLSIQFTTTLWFADVPGKFLERDLVVARRLLLMSSSAMPASAAGAVVLDSGSFALGGNRLRTDSLVWRTVHPRS